MEPKLTLIGTVHLDYSAGDWLYRHLEKIRPACITVEISPFSVEYRALHQKAWIEKLSVFAQELSPAKCNHARIRLLERQIRIPYEWSVALKYAKAHGIGCLPVDSDELAREELPQWEQTLLSKENISALVREPDFDLEKHFKSCYEQALQVIRSPETIPEPNHPLSWLSDGFWEQREYYLAENIRKITSGNGPVVHIGGWMHLVIIKRWPTVAGILADIKPDRLLASRV